MPTGYRLRATDFFFNSFPILLNPSQILPKPQWLVARASRRAASILVSTYGNFTTSGRATTTWCVLAIS
jgi:hypothetical protein